jgi:hypothetical protein
MCRSPAQHQIVWGVAADLLEGPQVKSGITGSHAQHQIVGWRVLMLRTLFGSPLVFFFIINALKGF